MKGYSEIIEEIEKEIENERRRYDVQLHYPETGSCRHTSGIIEGLCLALEIVHDRMPVSQHNVEDGPEVPIFTGRRALQDIYNSDDTGSKNKFRAQEALCGIEQWIGYETGHFLL